MWLLIIQTLPMTFLIILRLHAMDSLVSHSLGLAHMRLRKGAIFHK